MLTEDVKISINESVLCWLATVNEAGVPNCSPKEAFTFRGESELVIANIASPESVGNVLINPNVCVSFVHVFKQKGFKLSGTAEYIATDSPLFPELFSLIHPMTGETFPVKGVFLVSIERVKPVVAPSYYLIPGTTEESQIASAKRTYGV